MFSDFPRLSGKPPRPSHCSIFQPKLYYKTVQIECLSQFLSSVWRVIKLQLQPQVLCKVLLRNGPFCPSTLTVRPALTCRALTFVSITSGLVVLFFQPSGETEPLSRDITFFIPLKNLKSMLQLPSLVLSACIFKIIQNSLFLKKNPNIFITK